MKIRLHHKQGIVFQDTSRFKVLATGRRFGKTVLACIILFIHAIEKERGIYWVVNPTFRQSKQNTWKILIDLIPPEVLAKKPNETELSFSFKNGSEIVLKGADNPDSLRGSGLDGLVVDEFASIRNVNRVWQEVLRPTLTDKQGWCLFISTPKGKDAFWDLWMKGQRGEDGYKSWRFKTEDNPYIPRSEIKEAKEQLNERYFRQEYEASFEDFTGLIYPEFSETKHVFNELPIDAHWERVGAIDPAITGTFAALFGAFDENGVCYVFGEYYERDRRVSEVVEIIKGQCDRWLGDPAGRHKTFNRNGQLYSIFDEFLEYGLQLEPADNDVDSGINRVAEYFKADKIKIHASCKNLIEELLIYHWSEEKETSSGIMKPKPYKSRDHLCFVKDTMILMADRTLKSIADIKTGEFVMTSNGVQRVIDSRMTGKDIEVLKVKFSNGAELIGTPSHKIYTKRGKVRLDCLSYLDTIETWIERENLMDKPIVGMENTFSQLEAVSKAENVCTQQSGNFTMGRFLRECASIILITIQRITSFLTWRAFQDVNMHSITPERILRTKNTESEQRPISTKTDPWQLFGTDLMKEENGTLFIRERFTKTDRRLRENVLSVGYNTKQKTVRKASSFALMGANQISDCGLALMTSEENVYSAKNHSSETNTQRRSFVHVDAVNPCGQQDVYNLTVENSHNYFANGILVSNCDSLKYLIASRSKAISPEKKHPENTFAAFEEQERIWKEQQAQLKEYIHD